MHALHAAQWNPAKLIAPLQKAVTAAAHATDPFDALQIFNNQTQSFARPTKAKSQVNSRNNVIADELKKLDAILRKNKTITDEQDTIFLTFLRNFFILPDNIETLSDKDPANVIRELYPNATNGLAELLTLMDWRQDTYAAMADNVRSAATTDLQAETDRLEAAAAQAANRQAEAEQRAEEAEAAARRAQEALDGAKGEQARLRAQAARDQAEKLAAEARADEAATRAAAAEAESKAAAASQAEAEQRAREAKAAVDEATAARRQAEAAMQAAQSAEEKAEARAELAESKRAEAEAKADAEAARAAAAEARADAAQAKADAEAARAATAESLTNETSTANAAQQAELDAAKKQLEDAKKAAAAALAGAKTDKQKIAALTDQVEEFRAGWADAYTKWEALNTAQGEKDEEIARLTEQLAAAQAEKNEADEGANELSGQNTALEAQVADLRAKLAAAQLASTQADRTATDDLNLQIRQLTQKLNAALQGSSADQTTIARTQQERDAARSQLAKYENLRSSLLNDVEAAQLKLREYRTTAESEIKALRERIAALEARSTVREQPDDVQVTPSSKERPASATKRQPSYMDSTESSRSRNAATRDQFGVDARNIRGAN
jgi:hypothetical protein